MATHSSIPVRRIPWTEGHGSPQSMGHKESDTTEQLTYTCQLFILKGDITLLHQSIFFLIYWSVADLQCVLVSAVQHCEWVIHISTLKKKLFPIYVYAVIIPSPCFQGIHYHFLPRHFAVLRFLKKIVCIKGLLMPLSWMCRSLQVIIPH